MSFKINLAKKNKKKRKKDKNMGPQIGRLCKVTDGKCSQNHSTETVSNCVKHWKLFFPFFLSFFFILLLFISNWNSLIYVLVSYNNNNKKEK